MFSHVFLDIREFARAWPRRLAGGAGLVVSAVVGCAASPAAAEPVALLGRLQFAPGTSALAAAQRQTLDRAMQHRAAPWCVVVAVSRSGGPVTDLTALERKRMDYVAKLFALRDVAVVSTGIGWRQADGADNAMASNEVTWGEVQCPGTVPSTIDPLKPAA